MAVTALVTFVQAKVDRKKIASRAQLSGWQNALLDALQAIRVNGAESRAFVTWAPRYAAVARLEYNGPLLARIAPALQLAVSLLGTIAVYAAAMAAGVSASEYMAFSSAFGMVLGAFMALANTAQTAAQISPLLSTLRPIMDATPEAAGDRPAPVDPTGKIDIDNVTWCAGGCPAMGGLANNGDMLTPDPYNCTFFNNGWIGRYVKALAPWRCLSPLPED